MSRRVAMLLLSLLAIAMVASAHGAPPPPDRDTRVLHDHNDDCGGDNPVGGATGGNCGGTHDLIALDAREAWDDKLGNALVFTLYLSEGASGTLEDTIAFKAGGKSHSLVLKTTDDERFTSDDFDKVGAKQVFEAANKRFTISGTVALKTLGLTVGDSLSEFSVASTRDGGAGDHMPGAYAGALSEDPPQGNAPTNYRRTSLALVGPTHYGSLRPDASSLNLEVDQERLVSVAVENELDDQAQSFQLSLFGANGVEAQFHDPASGASSGYSSTFTMDLDKGRESFVHVAVKGITAEATGILTIIATSDAGARLESQLPYGVGTAPPEPTTQTPTQVPEGNAESPGAGAAVIAVGLCAAVALARRR